MSFAPRDPDWESRCRGSFEAQAFMRLIGARLAALTPGRCTVSVEAKPEICQQRGFVHGGVTAALADTAAGFAAYSLMPAHSAPLTVEFKINLLAPALGDRFTATAQVVRAGRTLSVVEAEVVASVGQSEKAIAKMLATLMCMEHTSDRPKENTARVQV